MRTTNNMRAFLALALILAAIFAFGCSGDETSWPYETYSKTLTEPGIVVDIAYTPGNHGSGSGVGFSTSGDMVMTSNSVTLRPAWATIFQCPHGRFIIDGEETYNSVTPGDSVTIVYREVFKTYRHVNTNEVTDTRDTTYTRTLQDYDFLKAVKR